MKSASSRRKIDVFLKQNNDFRQKSLKSLRISMKSVSSRRKINVFFKQNNDFRQKSLKSLRNSMKSASSRRKIDVFLKQNNDFRQKSLKSLSSSMKSEFSIRPPLRLSTFSNSINPSVHPPMPGPAELIYINSRSTAKRLLLI